MASHTPLDPGHAWSENLLSFEAGAEVGRFGPQVEVQPGVTWGLLTCLALASIAMLLARAPVWPFTLQGGGHPLDAVMIAILLGMLLGNLWEIPRALQPGIKLAVKAVLPLGIALLGARLDLRALATIGTAGLLLGLTVIVVSVGLLLILGKVLRLPTRLATLLGVGTAICGGSAIIALAPVIEAEETDITFSVATVALLGLLAMFALPMVGHLLGMGEVSFGLWAGLTIHQTPQVLAAGFAYGPEAGGAATLVKLVRISMLAPVVFVAGLVYSRVRVRGGAAQRPRYRDLVPAFIVGLLAIVALRTLGLLPDLTLSLAEDSLMGAREMTLSSVGVASSVSKLCIVVSMAAVGLETKLAALRRTGLKPLAAALVAALTVMMLTLAGIRSLGI